MKSLNKNKAQWVNTGIKKKIKCHNYLILTLLNVGFTLDDDKESIV